jgi:hypothetical protein
MYDHFLSEPSEVGRETKAHPLSEARRAGKRGKRLNLVTHLSPGYRKLACDRTGVALSPHW